MEERLRARLEADEHGREVRPEETSMMADMSDLEKEIKRKGRKELCEEVEEGFGEEVIMGVGKERKRKRAKRLRGKVRSGSCQPRGATKRT